MKLPPNIHLFEVTTDLRGSSSGLRGRRRTYYTILKLIDHALFKMVRYVFLRPLRPELLRRLEGQLSLQINELSTFCDTSSVGMSSEHKIWTI
jgi:hypothetical protein